MTATATATATEPIIAAAARPSVTVEDVLSWRPCPEYPEARVRALLAGRGRWTALDFLGLDIPAKDRLWVVLRPELIDGRTLRLWACWCVRRTPLADGRTTWDLLDDERNRNAVEVAERFARGEATGEELAVAGSVAGSAARDAARDAARAVAWAAGAAAGAAAWDAQAEQLKVMLRGDE